MSYTHVIWDWNGTLFDDAWLCVEIENGILRRRGRPPISAEQYAEQFGFPVKDYYRRLGFDFDEEPFEPIGTEFFEEYSRRQSECRLQGGARDVLTACAESGLGQSVLSAYQHDALEELLEAHGVRRFFTLVVGLGDHYAGSKAANGKRLMERLDCHPRDVLLIGDTTHDAEVAAEMGTDCVLIPGGHQSRARLESCGVPVLNGLMDVLHGLP